MIEKILVAVDGSDDSEKAVAMAASLAAACKAKLIVFHAHLSGSALDEAMQLARSEHMVGDTAERRTHPLSRLSFGAGGAQDEIEHLQVATEIGDLLVAHAETAARERGVAEVETDTGSGDPSSAIIEEAKRRDVDLIVVGSRGLSRLAGLLLGSVSQKLVQLAPCSVLTVRG